MKARNIAEFGDFQTPASLAARVCSRLAHFNPRSIIEPSCGQGAFVKAAADAFPHADRVLGFDINDAHLRVAADATKNASSRVILEQADFFEQDWSSIVRQELGPWLIIGNPPWVTSSDLASMASNNLPEKSNFQKRRGFDAITGKANFDISEWMLLQALNWLGDRCGAIAVLCKNAVARKVLTQAWVAQRSIASASMFKINALAEFGAAVDACLFVLEVGSTAMRQTCEVYESLEANESVHTLGFDGKHLISNLDAYDRTRELAGDDPKYVWRSGIKHDCSKVMELRFADAELKNGYGELVKVEPEYLFPLLKSSDIGNGRIAPRGCMIVPQRYVGEDTAHIQDRMPNLWAYLSSKSDILDRRGSVIYRKSRRFSVFGVGSYTFAPWKVAISGFYKSLSFLIVPPANGRPVVFDDTVYFLPCSSEAEAMFIYGLLMSEEAQGFYRSAVHWDEKRPITVGLLKRLSLEKVAAALGEDARYKQFSGSLAYAKAA